MARPSNYSPELRARAVRMVTELTPDYPSRYAAITAVAQKLGIGTPETVLSGCVGPRSMAVSGPERRRPSMPRSNG